MASSKAAQSSRELLDVREVAALIGGHPETIRRWVRSGRLRARRVGHRFLIARADVEALVGHRRIVPTLAQWADRAAGTRERSGQTAWGRSAADLVIEDRQERSRAAGTHAGR